MTDRSKQTQLDFRCIANHAAFGRRWEQELAQAGHHQRIAEAGEYQGDPRWHGEQRGMSS